MFTFFRSGWNLFIYRLFASIRWAMHPCRCCYQFWYRFGISTDIMTLAILFSYGLITVLIIICDWLMVCDQFVIQFFSRNLFKQSICNKIWQIYFKIRNPFPLAHKLSQKRDNNLAIFINKYILAICILDLMTTNNESVSEFVWFAERWTH